MAKKDPKNQNNTLTFTTPDDRRKPDGTPKKCVESSPHTLHFCKRTDREIFLAAPATNSRPVVLTFSNPEEIFEKHSTSPLTLNPGRTEKWVIKSNIANLSAPDGDFANPRTTPGFASIGRLFKFKFERCNPEDHNDVHIEC